MAAGPPRARPGWNPFLRVVVVGRRGVSPLRLDFVLQTPLHYSGMPLDFMTSHVGMGPNCKTRIALLCYPVRQRRLITSQGCQYATAQLDYRCVEYAPGLRRPIYVTEQSDRTDVLT